MIKTTIAVIAGLMLVACGAGETTAPSKSDTSPSKVTAPASKDLTLTYFNLDG